jgi:hypothetical protein
MLMNRVVNFALLANCKTENYEKASLHKCMQIA